MEWISIKDRLPEIHKNVKVKLIDGKEYRCYRSMFYNKFKGEGFKPISFSDVTHWMPLPQPPKQ